MKMALSILTVMGLVVWIVLAGAADGPTVPETEEDEQETVQDQWDRIERNWDQLLYGLVINRSEYEIEVVLDHSVIEQTDRIERRSLLVRDEYGLLNLVQEKVREFHDKPIALIEDQLRSTSIDEEFRATLVRPDVEIVERHEQFKTEFLYRISPYLSQENIIQDAFNQMLQELDKEDPSQEFKPYHKDHWWASDWNGTIVNGEDIGGTDEEEIVEIDWSIEFRTYRGKLLLDGGHLYGG